MEKKIVFVGLDVDDRKFHFTCLGGDLPEDGFSGSCKPNAKCLAEFLTKRFAQKIYTLKLCYEAGYLGFSLKRELEAQGIYCEVVAPGSIPQVPGPKVKTDRVDARKLAFFFMKGLLTIVMEPPLGEESLRDFIRSRGFLNQQLKEVKNHIVSLCRRYGLRYRTGSSSESYASYWTAAHITWLEGQIKTIDQKTLKNNLTLLLSLMRTLDQQIETYDSQIESISNEEAYKLKSHSLMAYRGIDTLAAMKIISEVQNIERFVHPKALVSYTGLDVAEYSSGGKERKFGITKMGNSNLRSTLVEICQSAVKPPRIGRPLAARRKSLDQKFIQIADRAMHRLYRKSARLQQTGKHINKIKVAAARELIGFIWETLMSVKNLQPKF